ncbi:MAG: hypothetical protein IJ598_13915, partial [Ruminococcus sp.]|nr:hypothetical protein [Ruminococcus sp.]
GVLTAAKKRGDTGENRLPMPFSGLFGVLTGCCKDRKIMGIILLRNTIYCVFLGNTPCFFRNLDV